MGSRDNNHGSSSAKRNIWINKKITDDVDPVVTACTHFDESIQLCRVVYHSNGFQNLWFGYLILVTFCLLLCGLYSTLMCCKLPHLKYVIKWHVGIFLVNITIWFWVPCLTINVLCQVNFFCSYLVFAIPLVAGCFVLSLLDLYFSPEAKYFKNQKQGEETSKFLEKIRAAKPAVGLKIECFHYETRIRRNGRSRAVEKVTFRERRLFPIDGFLDVSQTPSKINMSGVTLFHISKSITPGDAYSQDAFHHFKNRYIAANNHRDQAMHTNIELVIPEFDMQDRVMTFSGRPPWWASKCCFYFLSCLNMSIILRILLRTRTTVFSILIEKKYFVDPNIERTFDFDTGFVGPNVVNNFVMAPQQVYRQPHKLPPAEGGYVPVPRQFVQAIPAAHQPHGGGHIQEDQPFIKPNDDPPPTYYEHHKFTTIA